MGELHHPYLRENERNELNRNTVIVVLVGREFVGLCVGEDISEVMVLWGDLGVKGLLLLLGPARLQHCAQSSRSQGEGGYALLLESGKGCSLEPVTDTLERSRLAHCERTQQVYLHSEYIGTCLQENSTRG